MRLIPNNTLNIDVFISFELNEDEFFGVFKNFMGGKQEFKTELTKDSKYMYVNKNYLIKLSNYFYRILCKWFEPKLGHYKTLTNVGVKDNFGKEIKIKENCLVELIDYDEDKPFINNPPVLFE